jgi:hypothetical protein
MLARPLEHQRQVRLLGTGRCISQLSERGGAVIGSHKPK